MTDDVIIKEAVRLVQDGVSVTFPVKGRSMLPFIFGGREPTPGLWTPAIPIRRPIRWPTFRPEKPGLSRSSASWA